MKNVSKMDENDFVGTGNWQFCAKWGGGKEPRPMNALKL